MEFAILGAVEVRDAGRVLALGGPKRRALLAILLLHANEVVSRDRLIEGLWGESPPGSVDQSLDSYVSRLRGVVGAERLLRQAPGYCLKVAPGELDLDRFDELVARAHPAAPGEAARLLREALALWRGAALADVLFEPFAALEAARLEERRLLVLERCIEAELDAGHGPELVPELERLVREHPLRERLLAHKMLALYRAGRQADALAALQSARRHLAAELGLEPGLPLRDLERRILLQDARLDATRRPHVPPRRPGRSAFVIGIAVLVAILGGGLVITHRPSTARPLARSDANRLISVTDQAVIDLPGPPVAAIAGFGSLWVADASGQTVTRVDPKAHAPIDRIRVRGQPGAFAIGGGALWVASTVGGTISRIDPATDTVTQEVRLGGANAAAITFVSRRLWVADSVDSALLELNPANGAVVRTFSLNFRPTSLAVDQGAIWIASHDQRDIVQFDPTFGQTVATVPVGAGTSAIVAVGRTIWVTNDLAGTVSQINGPTASLTVTTAVGSGPSAVALARIVQ